MPLIPLSLFVICLSFLSCVLSFQPHSIRMRKNYGSNSYYSISQKSNNAEDMSRLKRPNNAANLSLGFSQLRPFLDIAVPFFRHDEVGRNSLIAVVAMTFLNSGVSVLFSYVSRDFYNALNARDEAMFYEKIELFFLALVIAVPVSVYYRFLREKLSVYWREALTSKVLEKYYSNRTFYVMETLHNIDNPDQRISDDIKAFTTTSLSFLITILTSIIDLCSFSAILFQIYPGLFFAIIIYSGIGSFVTTKLGQSLVGLNYVSLQKEANFRFSLIRTRENAEAIAFYDMNASLERNTLWTLFKEVLENQMKIITTQRNLEYFTTSYRYLVQILPSLIVAPLYFARKIELGSISQSYGAFNHILSDFSLIINSFESLSAFSAGLTRLTTFLDMIDKGGWDMVSDTTSGSFIIQKSKREEYEIGTYYGETLIVDNLNISNRIKMSYVNRISMKEDILLECKNLTICTPDGSRTLVGNLMTAGDPFIYQKHVPVGVDLTIPRGARVLVVGPSGAGKSSFLRTIAGLWRVGEGEILWTLDSTVTTDATEDAQRAPPSVFFLPQKPYNLLGSLRQQIQYPFLPSNASSKSSIEQDSLLLRLLEQVRLADLADRVGGLDTVLDWSNVLSLGEQQRLAFARVMFNKPSTVVLDEATSALDLETEEALYHLLQSTGASYISVGHRPSLLRYHTQKLVLRGPGKDVIIVPIVPNSNDEVLVNLMESSG